jgi:hypothetical protein
MNEYNSSLPTIVDNPINYIAVTTQGHLLVEGIEEWITQLQHINFAKDIQQNGLLSRYVQDPKTGAKFLIARIEEKNE